MWGLRLSNWAGYLLNLMRIKQGESRKGCPACTATYLRLRQAQSLGKLLTLRSNHIMIALEGVLQFEQLRWREGGANAFRLAKRLQ